MREAVILKECLLAAAQCGATAFRNSRGMFLTLDGKRKTRAGLEAAGSSDIIGWLPDGRFLAIEVKRLGANPSDDQKKFIQLVKQAGGVAFVARSADDVMRELHPTLLGMQK